MRLTTAAGGLAPWVPEACAVILASLLGGVNLLSGRDDPTTYGVCCTLIALARGFKSVTSAINERQGKGDDE